jgi:tryptophan-rich sensory protein
MWTILYIFMLIAIFLVFLQYRIYNLFFKLSFLFWLLQLLGNFGWTPLFYGLHAPVPALVVLMVTFALTVTDIVMMGYLLPAAPFPDQVIAAMVLMSAYAAWLLYATSLNFYTVWWLQFPHLTWQSYTDALSLSLNPLPPREESDPDEVSA